MGMGLCGVADEDRQTHEARKHKTQKDQTQPTKCRHAYNCWTRKALSYNCWTCYVHTTAGAQQPHYAHAYIFSKDASTRVFNSCSSVYCQRGPKNRKTQKPWTEAGGEQMCKRRPNKKTQKPWTEAGGKYKYVISM